MKPAITTLPHQVLQGGRDPLTLVAIYVTCWHLVGLGLLLCLDPAATGFEPAHVRNVLRAVTSPPVWDDDEWYTNYVGHPLWGSETFLVARRLGYTRGSSFGLSTVASVFWEIAIEGWVEQPSIQDLMVTSTVGSLIGEWHYGMVVRGRFAGRRGGLATIVCIDPLWSATHTAAGILGGFLPPRQPALGRGQFSTQMARFSNVANATHARYGIIR